MYKRRRDMVPGDVYYSETASSFGYSSQLVQVLDEDSELTLERPEPRINFDGLFCEHEIFELVEEE